MKFRYSVFGSLCFKVAGMISCDGLVGGDAYFFAACFDPAAQQDFQQHLALNRRKLHCSFDCLIQCDHAHNCFISMRDSSNCITSSHLTHAFYFFFPFAAARAPSSSTRNAVILRTRS